MTYYVGNMPVGEDDLLHYGTKGMKWGRRNYQNRDGSLTAAGRMRYGYNKARSWGNRQYRSAKRWANRQVRSGKKYYRNNKDSIRRAARVAGAVAGTAALGYLGYRNRGALKTAGKLLGARASAAARRARIGAQVNGAFATRGVKRAMGAAERGAGKVANAVKRGARRARIGAQVDNAFAVGGARRAARRAGTAFSSAANRAAGSARNGLNRVKTGAGRMQTAMHPTNVKLRRKQLGLYQKTGIKNARLAGLGEKATTRAYNAIDRVNAASNKARSAANAVKRGASSAARKARVGAQVNGAFAVGRARRAADVAGRTASKAANVVKRGASSAARKARVGAQVNGAFAVAGAKRAGQGVRKAANIVKRGASSTARKARVGAQVNGAFAVAGAKRAAGAAGRGARKAANVVKRGASSTAHAWRHASPAAKGIAIGTTVGYAGLGVNARNLNRRLKSQGVSDKERKRRVGASLAGGAAGYYAYKNYSSRKGKKKTSKRR